MDTISTATLPTPTIRRLSEHIGQRVLLRGWLANKRSSGKLAFLQLRDGSGLVQGVASKADVSEGAWNDAQQATQESTFHATGVVKADARAPSGVELQLDDFGLDHLTAEFPITPKEHGTAFLMENRHLWLRSSRQVAALRVRSEVAQAIRDFFYHRDFTLIDSPILTPAACEGTSTLFETDYFGDKAYLSQSGQLYLEFEGLCELTEDFICYLVGRTLERCAEDLKVLERDVSKLQNVAKPFPRVTYTEAVKRLQDAGSPIQWGDDFGADEETALANQFDRPVMVSRYPTAMKAFYMQPDPENPDVVLGLDLLAPEGYGEIIGGSQRIHDHDLLLSRIQSHNLPISAFQWYLDVRKYGSFPHSGFGMGLERFVAWMGGLSHVRETIPYPRMLYKIYP